MKKILFSILIALLLILCFVVAFRGVQLFGLDIIGVSEIKEKNEQLDNTISEATKLASTDYEKALEDIESDIKKLKEEKKNYDELVSVSTGNEVQAANQYQKYEIEYLWAIVGNLATSEGVVLKMDLVSGAGQNIYNLNFTVKGSYIGISDFVYDIENDSALGFKIENFALNPTGSTEELEATFTCRNIEIKEVKITAEKQTNSNTTTNTTTSTTNTTSNNTANNTVSNTVSNTTSNTTTENDTTSTDSTNMIEQIR